MLRKINQKYFERFSFMKIIFLLYCTHVQCSILCSTLFLHFTFDFQHRIDSLTVTLNPQEGLCHVGSFS